MNQELLNKYAAFTVQVGVNVQKGQTLIIRCPVEGAYFGRACMEAAYKAGARDVVIRWEDEKAARIRMELGEEEALSETKPYELRSYLDYAESEGGCCLLAIHASDPEIFKGLDTAKINRVSLAKQEAMKSWREYTMKDRVQWCVVAIPTPAWAASVFPGLAEDEAQEKLWSAIFDVCRVTGGDPVSAWKEHVAKTSACRDKLNELQLESIHMTSANGTDLTVGLAEGHTWEGACSKAENGAVFIANVPTEEVFTAPHRERVNGVVKGTKPYVYNGQLIEGFSVTFKDGVVVDYSAEKNAELLGQLLDSDEGARRIGEIALVPASSPINRSGLLFYNTLFDENAACHIAFGAGYPTTVKGGAAMTTEQLLACGVNDSAIHEDVMVGAEDMTITGLTKTGETVTIFENGEWAIG
ncbi:aminopeptidase [Allofournierella massiliensis]|uniref:Aminopeptidase n=1 Tax=Allofournierella massiliensis TaxID=1650663 RepID=A0ABT7ULV1_9FIRM|nr:aminopeptidase [Fournierella massiliensis]MDM8199886.1 aminopeptidase [Fournierella massiliensis]